MRKKLSIRVFVSLLMALFATGVYLNIFSPVRGVLLTVLAPSVKQFGYLPVALRRSVRTVGFISKQAVHDLENEKAEVLTKLRQEEAKNESLHQLIDEYAALSPDIHDIAVASIVMRNIDGFSESLMIDIGQQSGIREGMMVMSGGALIGAVKSVTNNQSVVEYVFSPFIETQGVLIGSDVPILLEGKGAGFFTSRVPKEVAVQVGNAVINNASDKFVLGEVVSVLDNPASPYRELLIRTTTNPSTMQQVLIIK